VFKIAKKTFVKYVYASGLYLPTLVLIARSVQVPCPSDMRAVWRVM
jgi:hypothetical protein